MNLSEGGTGISAQVFQDQRSEPMRLDAAQGFTRSSLAAAAIGEGGVAPLAGEFSEAHKRFIQREVR